MAVSMVGCAGSTTRPPVESLNEGMNVLQAEAGRVSAAYRQGANAVYIEVRRGQLAPEIYRAEHVYEEDVMVTDKDGSPIYIAVGGDRMVDPSFSKALHSVHPMRSAQVEEGLTKLMWAASDTLAATPALMPSEVAHEVKAFHAVAHSVTADTLAEKVQIQNQMPAVTGEAPYSCTWTHVTKQYRICLVPILGGGTCTGQGVQCAGDHSSASMVSTGASGCASVTINSMNHMSSIVGTCGTYWTGPNHTGRTHQTPGGGYFAEQQTSQSDGSGTSGGCLTAYDWTSSTNGHNCNDDSQTEGWQIKNDSQNITRGNQGSSSYCNNGNSVPDGAGPPQWAPTSEP